MRITATMVKELRERSGAGMMECKKALVETGGDMEAAIELMRKSGAAKADKKAHRVAAEGVVVIRIVPTGKTAVMVEINSETDFVAKDENFRNFADAVAAAALDKLPADVESLNATTLADGATVDEARQALIAKIGENINVRRLLTVDTDGVLASYVHGNRIGVVVCLEGGDATLARDIAMHVAASRPLCIEEADVPAEELAKERDIFTAQAEESGKPINIIEKMVAGRVKKYLKEVTLVGQPFVKDPDQAVGQLLQAAAAKVTRFERLEVGEGVEKREENFAAEVMAQVEGG